MNPTSSLNRFLRPLTRRLGLNRLLAKVIMRGAYEDRFGKALEKEIKHGDVVWDVGANVGLYTTIFLDLVGTDGYVIAFEPTLACYGKLREKCANYPNALLHNVAMGEKDGTVAMSIEADQLAATHRIVKAQDSEREVIEVSIRSADSFAREFPANFPNIIKVDVEGHEGSVIDGMDTVLSDRRLRCVGVEVHFGLLDERGESHRPKMLEDAFIRHDFVTFWTDPSHLIARRS